MYETDAEDRDQFSPDESEPQSLPPVTPPSAGFIVQLFLVPALIVMVVVGVWALFGRLAAGEQDWRSLVAELRSQNEHRRWRAALGLAQVLKADEQRGERGQHLAQNTEIAAELTRLLDEGLRQTTPEEDDLKQQAFLARTLGMLDAPEQVLPVLETAMQPERDRDVRKNAIASVALIAGRAVESRRPLDVPPLTDELLEISADSDPLLRQMGAYVLGLLPGEPSRQRLSVLLSDADPGTRVNAAVGLVRQDSTEGLPVFKAVVEDALGPAAGEDSSKSAGPGEPDDESQQAFQKLVALKNSVHAVSEIAPRLEPDQRTEWTALLERLAEEHPEPRIRLDATAAVLKLKQSP